jgi:hypothetical protein
MRSVLLAAIASIGLVGCVGELDTTGGGGNTGGGDDQGSDGSDTGSGGAESAAAKMAYDSNVYPIMVAKCNSCHAAAGPVGNISGFVAPDVSTAWATATGYQSFVGSYTPESAPVLLKISAGHNAITYSSDEVNKITDWLNQEVLWRNGGGGSGDTGSGSGTTTGETPAQATQRLLSEWSACMTKTNFDTANMANRWGNMTAQNNQRCSNCHASGDGGFIASVDSQLFFDVVSSNKYYMLQYFSVKLDLTDLTKSTVEINTKSFLGVSQGQDPHREHPRFNATDNNGMTALQQFYDLTKQAVTAGNCGPSKLTN